MPAKKKYPKESASAAKSRMAKKGKARTAANKAAKKKYGK